MGNCCCCCAGKKVSVGEATYEKVSASQANVKVNLTERDVRVGLLAAGKGTEFKNESIQAKAAPSAIQSDAVACKAPGPRSMGSLMRAMKDMPPGAYGTIAEVHVVTGTSERTAEHEAGATGLAVPLLAGSVHVKDEVVRAIARAGPTDEEKRVYADSWKSTLHDWADEDSYALKGDGCGLIISNTFDDPDSAGKFGDSYKNITRHGGKEDRRRVRALFKHLNIKILGDHENVKSDELPGILEEFRELVHRLSGGFTFVIIMSHGGRERPDTVLMDDLVEVDARKQIIYALGDNGDLRNIPKIFLFNMCRDSWKPWVPAGADEGSSVQSDSQSGGWFGNSLRDTLLLFTTLPYEVSLRDAYTGAMYITEMDRIFQESANKRMLRKMLYDINMAVLEKHGQTPVVEDCLFKNLKFKPKK